MNSNGIENVEECHSNPIEVVPLLIFSIAHVTTLMDHSCNETLDHPKKLSFAKFFLLKFAENGFNVRFHHPKPLESVFSLSSIQTYEMEGQG